MRGIIGQMRHRVVLVVLATAFLAFARAEDSREAAERSQELVARSLAELHRGDQLAEGWEEAYERGLALATQAAELDPGNAEAYYARFCHLGRKAERSSLASQMMHLGELRDLLEKTLELDPRHAHAWEARGEMLLRMPWLLGGSTSEGEAALRRAAELAPRWAKPPLRLAELEADRDRDAAARELAMRARDLAEAAGDEGLRTAAEALLQRIDAAR